MARKKWRQLPGFSNYKISYEGQVKDLVTKTTLKPKTTPSKQEVYTLKPDNRDKIIAPAEYLVASLFLSRPTDSRAKVYHKDGNKKNNHVDNLYWIIEDPYLICIKFYNRPDNYPVNAFWRKNNVLCIPSKKPLTDKDREVILNVYKSQDTSGQQPYLCA